MSKRIYKYPLIFGDEAVVQMPEGAVPIAADIQSGAICVWAAVDPEAKVVPRHFFIRGTGHEMPPAPYRHLATIMDGQFVWHVFDGLDESARQEQPKDEAEVGAGVTVFQW